MKGVGQCRQRDGQRDIMQQPAQIFQRVGNALQKMHLAFVESAKPVCPERLHDADINVGVVVPHERFAIQIDEYRQRVQIMIEQLLAQFWRQIRFGVVEQRSTSYCSAPLRPP